VYEAAKKKPAPLFLNLSKVKQTQEGTRATAREWLSKGEQPKPPARRRGYGFAAPPSDAQPQTSRNSRRKEPLNANAGGQTARRGALTARPPPSGAANSNNARPGSRRQLVSRNGQIVTQHGQTEERAASKNGAQLHMTASIAVQKHGKCLSQFELKEIKEYKEVWYVGQNAANKLMIPADAHVNNNNHGYDDSNGDYNVVMNDHLGYRFEVLDALGKGSFGQVIRCYDYKKSSITAMKIIKNKQRFHRQAKIEVKLLQYIKEKDPEDVSNIVQIDEVFNFRNHLLISFELLSIDLYQLTKNNHFKGLSLGLIRRFAVQMLSALNVLRKLRIIHCDLKPENVLLKHANRSAIKIIDLGSSCFEDERVYTYIQSRFYRSPEIILGLPYNQAIDMWSTGCILAEMYTGYPLFPGENEMEQLSCIMEVFGTPPKEIVDSSNRRKMFFDSQGGPRIVPNSRGKKRKPGNKELAHMISCSDAGFVDFLKGCLRWDQRTRFTPEDAIQHPWILEALQQ